MLSDGSNPEGVDPDPPLGWKSKESLREVVLYNGKYSPPCAKVRYHLAYHGVPYKVEEGSNKESVYRKIPSLTVSGRNVNDSFIITKNLVPALYGTPFNSDWEKKITFGFQLALEVEGFDDDASLVTIAGFGGYSCLLASFLKCCCCCFLPIGSRGSRKIANGIRARRAEKDAEYGPLMSAQQYLDEFKSEIGAKSYFGGEKPDAIDVSMFATLKPWETVPITKRLIPASGLDSWFTRMNELMPKTVPGG